MVVHVLHTPEEVREVWHIAFEYSGVAKVGGLAEAVRVMAIGLKERGFNVKVLMPSHGVHLDQGSRLRIEPLDFETSGKRVSVDGWVHTYRIGAERVLLDGVEIVLFKGLDTHTRLLLDARNPYDNVEEKAALLARAVRAYAERYGFPDLVHAHDWHSVLAAVALKDLAESKGLAIPLVYTIHLSSSKCFPWHYASEAWAGLPDRPHPVWRGDRHVYEPYSRVWSSVGGCVEHFGVLESDVFTSVSHGYLDEILSKYGWWLRGKSCVVYNSTAWSIDEVRSWLSERYGSTSRRELRWRLVDEALKSCPDKVGWLEYGGPLYIVSGRITLQKGFDIAVRALEHNHSARLLILGIPVGDHDYESYIASLINQHWGQVVMLKCKLSSKLYKSLYYAATGTLMPSRWEPFGIVAIESMAVGTPVIASAVGGLKEVIVDLREDPDKGTGLLVEPENPSVLADAMSTLQSYVEDNLAEEERIRRNCVARVEELFRPEKTTNMLIECYEKARQMAYHRAQA
jgi:starch synthase